MMPILMVCADTEAAVKSRHSAAITSRNDFIAFLPKAFLCRRFEPPRRFSVSPAELTRRCRRDRPYAYNKYTVYLGRRTRDGIRHPVLSRCRPEGEAGGPLFRRIAPSV